MAWCRCNCRWVNNFPFLNIEKWWDIGFSSFRDQNFYDIVTLYLYFSDLFRVETAEEDDLVGWYMGNWSRERAEEALAKVSSRSLPWCHVMLPPTLVAIFTFHSLYNPPASYRKPIFLHLHPDRFKPIRLTEQSTDPRRQEPTASWSDLALFLAVSRWPNISTVRRHSNIYWSCRPKENSSSRTHLITPCIGELSRCRTSSWLYFV